MRRFFIEPEQARDRRWVITGPEARHMAAVVRIRPGERVVLFDGEGKDYVVKTAAVSSHEVSFTLLDERSSTAESPVPITLGQSFLKEKKMDTLVRQLTELGIARWLPFFSERSIPTPDQRRMSGRTERWRKIAAEALKQCGRGRMPEICAPVSFEAMLEEARTAQVKIAFWEEAHLPLTMTAGGTAPPTSVFLLLGPEGGFSREEMEKAEESGFHTVSLGPRILRAETATLAAAALVQYLFGDMGKKVLDKKEGGD